MTRTAAAPTNGWRQPSALASWPSASSAPWPLRRRRPPPRRQASTRLLKMWAICPILTTYPKDKTMIPPISAIRLRSIKLWLTASDPQAATLPPEALNRRVQEMDDQMMEDFESREDVLKAQMMANKTWGTPQGLTQFPTDRMMLWQEVTTEFLPTTSDQAQES
jgi:hypothetical protein